ncbi:type III PLP-dependent enzyme [Rhizomicrobium electricum]|jgi:ornithine decarboxylase|uniref:ornithine decarboxylase n=1 Tax=Rhizomicrobium electricum TaxID=480070 RepID=A0ABN1EID9_9PROT|nr:type III PLP-dependent enzyme [Rhizomicrobium electricum]NIJ48381.1 ornithine decarboxylase [Rhizomicrobium electricum]
MAIPRFATVEEAISTLKPIEPIYALQPAKFKAAAVRFLDSFPGTPMYAVKANPAPLVLDQVWDAGIRHFDTASLGEVRMIKTRFPDAVCHFMAPVRLTGHAKAAFEDFGVTDFVVDSDYELDKLLGEIPDHSKIRVFVRLAAALGGALLELSSKFGTNPEEGARLLKRVVAAGAKPAITFHVGSQCLSSFSYAQAVEIVRRAIDRSGVKITALDIGGGFPAPYLNNDVPPYLWYFDTIREAIDTLEIPGLPLYCEPGRALVAEGVSVITQVVSRKNDRLYLNDGTYGSFDELTLPGFDADYPNRVFTRDAMGRVMPLAGKTKPYRVYGPTCDTLDVLPRPQMLPESITPGDFIVFDAMGAYTVAVRTTFNGFWNDTWIELDG